MTPQELATLATDALAAGDTCDRADCPTCGPEQDGDW